MLNFSQLYLKFMASFSLTIIVTPTLPHPYTHTQGCKYSLLGQFNVAKMFFFYDYQLNTEEQIGGITPKKD